MVPKLSIQITLHNRVKFIRASILSALGCKYEDSEIIVFDDASSDGSGEEVKRLAGEYPGRIRYIRSETNMGCAGGRAAMADMTKADYILVLDDDDILLPFDIAGQIELLDRNPGFAVSYGKTFVVDECLKPLNASMGGNYSRFILAYNTPVTHPAAIIRRSNILEAGNYRLAGYSTKAVAEDLYLWFNLSLKKDFHFDNSFRLLYRQHASQTTLKENAYLEAANFIHKKIIEANKNIYDRIISGKIDIAPHESKTVLLLFAVISRYMPSASPQRLRILNTAESIAPEDYGINAVKFEYFFETGNYSAAMAEAEKMLEKYGADIYIRKLSLEKIIRVCEKTGTDASEIRKQTSSLNYEYSHFDLSKISLKEE